MGADVAALEIRRASAVEKLGSCRVAVELSLGPIIQEGRINFRCTMQICWELGIKMIQGIIHLIHLSYFFLVISGRFLAEAVVMNCWEIICASYEFWIRQVETGRLTVWVLHPWHMWIYVAMCPPFPQFPPPPGTPGRPDESNKSWWTTLDHQQWLNFMNC